MNAGRQFAKAVFHRFSNLTTRQTSDGAQQHIEAKTSLVLAHKIKDKAGVFARGQPQPATNLLLEDHGALCGSQQKHGIRLGNINAFIEDVATANHLEDSVAQLLNRFGPRLLGISPAQGNCNQARLSKATRHELSVSHADAKGQTLQSAGVRHIASHGIDNRSGPHQITVNEVGQL